VCAHAELLRAGAVIDAKNVPIKAHDAASAVFDVAEMHEGALQLRVRSGDSLKLDDVATAAINPPQRRKVLLVTPGNEPLDLALGTDSAAELAEVSVAKPAVLETKEHLQQVAS